MRCFSSSVKLRFIAASPCLNSNLSKFEDLGFERTPGSNSLAGRSMPVLQLPNAYSIAVHFDEV